MDITQLSRAARAAVAPYESDGRSVVTLTTLTTNQPPGWLVYDTESVTARFCDGSQATIDLDRTPFAEALETYADQQAAIYGFLGALTLRLVPEPDGRPAVPLDARTALFVISIHARAAAHRPGLPVNAVLTLQDLAYETNDTARHGSHYRAGSLETPRALAVVEKYQRTAATYGLPIAREATAQFLRHTARLALRTIAYADRPFPDLIELPAGHFGTTPTWLTHRTTTRYADGTTRDDISYPPPALDAVLNALAALETPAAGDRLILDLTATPLENDPIPKGHSVYDTMPGEPFTADQLSHASAVLGADAYVVQLRSGGAWHLPNHDDQAALDQGQAACALRRLRDNPNLSTARFSRDTDGTVYGSNGKRAVRYIPTTLIPDYSDAHCPGCHTPYVTNGDGPCGS
ncbi:hypothetical protein SLUN_00855 [Streptomyces lunaelactis]|uniref:Uncharacterized protein n=1 Tax=Streptomyces lunaelactis TaxID=1535768 RepID=A0A2R4SVY6_9ACTN|nr:hypothetical protein [Streptomyces lunaelactis]AVZ71018.1 hypothetical protein SLUN_00855 [Streptomyces lunaelactis]NUK28398.1 hypothetical protein [Streptomyces lunaelactis]